MDLREDLSPSTGLSLPPEHMRKHPEVSHDLERMRDVMRMDLNPEGNCHQDRAGLILSLATTWGTSKVMKIKGGLDI